MRRGASVPLLVAFLVVLTLSSMATPVSAASWYEYEYYSYYSDDYYTESGWPVVEGTGSFWLHSEVTIRYKYRVTYIPRIGFRRTLVAVHWYKVEHWCRLKWWWDPDTWRNCYTQVHMYIHNEEQHYWKWSINPLGNHWHWVEYPGVLYESKDHLYDRAYSHAWIGWSLQNHFYFG